MANDKKAEKKTTENKTEAPAASAAPVTALTVIQNAGLKIPTAAEMAAIDKAVEEKYTALMALADDTSLSDVSRQRVQALVAQASPNKPGMEEMNVTWTVPRIILAQPTTNDDKKPANAKAGDYYNTLGQLLDKPFAFIPIYFNQENIMFKKGEKAPECSSLDAKLGAPYGVCAQCPHLPFGQQNGGRGEQKQTECNNQIVVAALAADLSQVYTMQFAKTSRSAGSALMGLAKGHPFPWKQAYLLNSEKKTGDQGVWYVSKIEPTGKDNSDDAIKIAAALSALYKAERQRRLGEWYMRAASAPASAAAAETAFAGSSLDAGLGGDDGADPDLSAPPAAAASARSASKPM